MAASPQDRIAKLIRDLEKAAKQLRNDIRKRAQAAPKNLQTVADRLRKQGAEVAAQVEKYVHELRMSLEGKKAAPAKRKAAPARKKKAAPKRTRRA